MNRKPLVFTLAALMCALFSPKPAAAQGLPIIPEENRPAIAFWDKAPDEKAAEGLKKISSVLSTLLTTEFQNQGEQQVTIVNRENLPEHLKEMAIALTGVVDPKTAAETGKMIGAKYSVIATITRFNSKELSFDPKDFPLWMKIIWDRTVKEIEKTGRKVNARDIVNFVLKDTKVKTATFDGKLNVGIYDVEASKLVVSADEEGKTSNVGVEIAKIGNDVSFDDNMVSAVFEPIVKRITPKLIKGLVEKLNLASADN